MRIRLSEVSPHGNHYEIVEKIDFVEQDRVLLEQPVHAKCCLTKKDQNKVTLTGTVHAEMGVCCDRCLELYTKDVESDFQVIFEMSEHDSWHVKDLECTAEDLDIIALDAPEIDLFDILRQQLFLSLPVKRICNTHCKGICADCGINLNLETCICSQARSSSPFAVLSKLKESK